jgi:hypothetical protein
MFRRIVSNLSFSPALVGQLGFYARRLRKEEATRRLGLVFTALALVVQSLAVFSPPEAANATTPGQVGSAPRCTVESVGPRGQAFEVTGNEAKVAFDVKGSKNCKVQVSANSFFAPSMDGRPYDKQILHDRNTRVFDTPGRYTMKTTLPNKSNEQKGCFYQVDLTYGTYNVTPVLAYGHGKLDCGTVVIANATCTSFNAIKASPNRFNLRATASTTNAKVNKFVFDITKPNGQTVEKTVNTDQKTAVLEFDAPAVGTYSAKATVHTTVGNDSGPQCKANFVVEGPATPTAVCTNVGVTITNRTQAYFTGAASVSGGATIRSYTFIVRNAAGIEVTRSAVQSGSPTAATSAIDIPSSGNYTVQLVVQTSLGDKTDPACSKPFTIVPPEVCQYNPSLPVNSPDCQPCPDNPNVWIKDEKCVATLVNTKTATNMTQGMVEASTVTARAGDKVSYTITIENKGLVSEAVTMQEDLADVLEYATLVDQAGGELNQQTKVLTWPSVTLAAGQKQTRTIAVQMMGDIPVTNTGTGVPTSYDCKMMNTFGNTINVNVDCPTQKVVVEQVVGELPKTGPRENMIFAAVLLSVVVYFYARSRQLGTEVRLIRRNLNTGTI